MSHKLLLTGAESARYWKVIEWYRANVNRQVSSLAEAYITERVMTGRPIKGSALVKIGEEPRSSVHDKPDTINLFEEEL
jgi:hypothetical protein